MNATGPTADGPRIDLRSSPLSEPNNSASVPEPPFSTVFPSGEKTAHEEVLDSGKRSGFVKFVRLQIVRLVRALATRIRPPSGEYTTLEISSCCVSRHSICSLSASRQIRKLPSQLPNANLSPLGDQLTDD